MNAIRILFALCAVSALLAAQTSPAPSTTTTPTTRPRSQTATTPTTNSHSAAGSRVTLSSGTPIEVRVNESLSSETTQQGERFTGTVTSDVTDPNTNRVLIPRGAEVTGRVLSATPSGRLSNSGELQLSVSTIRYGTAVANVTVEPYVIKGGSQTKSTATKVGGGAALGAIIGAIAGGGKGAAIGAGVGGAAGAGTAAATGKRPAEVQPEALVKFITSGDTMVTAADQSGYSNTTAASTSPNASQSTTWPEPSRPATSSTTQSTANSSTTSTDTSADTTVNSDNSDVPPVMHRRDGTTATTPSTSTDNSTGTAATRNSTTTASNTATTAGNATYGTSNPPAASTGVYGSATTPANSTATRSTTTTAITPAAPSTTTSTTSSSTSSLPDNRLFSARDRRVVNQCIRDNGASLPSSYMHKGTAMSGYQRGQVLSADVQRQLRSLPLACDNQLPAVSNDLERVIYGGQVMLIDSSNRVLDVFDLNP
jgi:outer membrane lipoprotein SlyB